MASQTMVLMGGVSTQSVGLRKNALLNLQINKLMKPNYNNNSKLFFFSPLPSGSSPRVLKTFALFKSKSKAPPPKKVEKTKLKVEDGLFGTSGGIGFTKENELFVGRVAMIGFASPKKDASEEEPGKALVATVLALLITLTPMPSIAIEAGRGAALFRRACIGCHDAGGNLIQAGATLFSNDLERNGVDSEDEIYNITYSGKGRMPGFGEKCTPRGQCTFGPRLQDDEIRLLAQFVKSQADQGWQTIP